MPTWLSSRAGTAGSGARIAVAVTVGIIVWASSTGDVGDGSSVGTGISVGDSAKAALSLGARGHRLDAKAPVRLGRRRRQGLTEHGR